MEPEGSLPLSQVATTCPCSEPAQSSPYPHIPKSNINTRKKCLFRSELCVRLCALTMQTETHTGPRVRLLWVCKVSTKTEIAFNIPHRISENNIPWTFVQLFSKGQVHMCTDIRIHVLRDFSRRSTGMRMCLKHVINIGRQPNHHCNVSFSQR